MLSAQASFLQLICERRSLAAHLHQHRTGRSQTHFPRVCTITSGTGGSSARFCGKRLAASCSGTYTGPKVIC